MTSEHHLIPSLTEGLFLFDREGRLVLLNPSGERLIGRSEKALLGKTANEIFPRNPDLCSILENTLNEGRSLAHHSISLANFEGNELYLSISVSILEDHDGAIQGQVLLARDDTVLSELDRSFRRADLLTTLGTLNLGIAHEIKNPLGGIKGATQLLRSELGKDSPLAENCDIILREVERIDSLLESLLSATPTDEIPLKELNIHEVLIEVIDLMGHWEEGPAVTYVKVLDPSLPAVMADRSGLTQVFLNLLKNSLEAAPPDSEIIIRTTVPQVGSPHPIHGRMKGVVQIDIEDSGPGFDLETHDFSAPFFTTKPKGVGLGLAISEQIIQNHGGRLVLENRDEGGAKVSVLLPISTQKTK